MSSIVITGLRLMLITVQQISFHISLELHLSRTNTDSRLNSHSSKNDFRLDTDSSIRTVNNRSLQGSNGSDMSQQMTIFK